MFINCIYSGNELQYSIYSGNELRVITVLYEPAESATAVTIVDHGVRVVTFMPLS